VDQKKQRGRPRELEDITVSLHPLDIERALKQAVDAGPMPATEQKKPAKTAPASRRTNRDARQPDQAKK
jgi:hypothetical protein